MKQPFYRFAVSQLNEPAAKQMSAWLKEQCGPNNWAMMCFPQRHKAEVSIRDQEIAAIFLLTYPNVTRIEKLEQKLI